MNILDKVERLRGLYKPLWDKKEKAYSQCDYNRAIMLCDLIMRSEALRFRLLMELCNNWKI